MGWKSYNGEQSLERFTDITRSSSEKVVDAINDTIVKLVGNKETRALMKFRKLWKEAYEKAVTEGQRFFDDDTRNSRDINSGYSGYSMSNRAAEAYRNGEKPKSKWTKTDILNYVTDYAEENDINFDIANLKKLPVRVIKDLLLTQSSWHHTSEYFNRTDFYSVNENVLDTLTDKDILKANIEGKKEVKEENPKYKGDIEYIEWSGTKNHPKATEKKLENVTIEEKGSFYIVYDKNGEQILRKKIGSNGTRVISNEEKKRRAEAETEMKRRAEERENNMRNNSSAEALTFYDSLKYPNFSRSNSGHIYAEGRKPSRWEYENGLEKFFKVGENRLFQDNDGTLYLETWDGNKWVKESDTRHNRKVENDRIRYSKNSEGEVFTYLDGYIYWDELVDGIQQIVNMKPTAYLTGNELPRIKDTTLKETVNMFFKDKKLMNPQIGDIVFNEKKSFKDDRYHGIGPLKIASYSSVPEVLKEGRVILYNINWKNRGHDTALIAAPIKIGDKDYFEGITLKRLNGKNQFYVHEVYAEKSSPHSHRGGINNVLTTSGELSMNSILKIIIAVKNKTITAEQAVDIFAKDERGIIPKRVSSQEQTPGNVTRYSRDLDYLAAVEQGDMETAQRMVDEAAKEAGYNYARNTNNHLKPFNKVPWMMFAYEEEPHDSMTDSYGKYRFVATDNDSFATVDFEDDIQKLAKEYYGHELEDREIYPQDIVDSAGMWDDMNFVQYLWDNLFEDIWSKTNKIPAITTPDGLIVMGEDNLRVKSADPVTYDDNGNVIPLSQRFNPDEEDIRYSRDVERLPKQMKETIKVLGDELKAVSYKRTRADNRIMTDRINSLLNGIIRTGTYEPKEVYDLINFIYSTGYQNEETDDGIIDVLGKITIKVPEYLRGEMDTLGGLQAINRKMYGKKLTFSYKKGVGLDDAYNIFTNVNKFYDSDVTPEEQVENLMDAYTSNTNSYCQNGQNKDRHSVNKHFYEVFQKCGDEPEFKKFDFFQGLRILQGVALEILLKI